MSYGMIKTFAVTIASGASTSSSIPLGGRPWTAVGVQVGTMSTAAAVKVQNSVDGGSSYFNVFHQTINSSTVGTPQMFIASGVGTGGGYTVLPLGGVFNNIRFVASDVVSGGVSFTVVASD